MYESLPVFINLSSQSVMKILAMSLCGFSTITNSGRQLLGSVIVKYKFFKAFGSQPDINAKI